MKPSKRSARPITSRPTFPPRKWRAKSYPCRSVVAEDQGQIVGSNFLDERSCIASVGPITVDPTTQNRGLGLRLMQDVLDRAARQQKAGVRLLQAGYHNRSLCLYTKLGFCTREPVSALQGKPLGQRFPGYEVRPATAADVAACNRVCAGPWI
jgi:GNAT superfamily N-acetyltransferase